MRPKELLSLRDVSTKSIERLKLQIPIAPRSECWPWPGTKSVKGYGVFSFSMGGLRSTCMAHRAVWMLLRGDLPPHMTIDHLCRNRACVNTAHMEVVSVKTNVLRGVGHTARNARKTLCPKGHEYDATGYRGERKCHRCAAAHTKAWRKRQAAKRLLAAIEGK